ncbi:DeoR/GlpR transcriptional regulator, partial [Salmonella enterica]
LKRSFGGAIYTAQPVRAAVSHEVVQSQALEHSVELELAKQVARLVCDDDTVFLGAGEVLRKALPFLGDYRDLCLIINDLSHVAPARDYIDGEIVLLGGVLGHSGQALGGEIAIQSLQQFQPSCCLVMV